MGEPVLLVCWWRTKRSGTLVDAPQGGWYFGELRRLCRVAKEMPVLRKLEMSKWPSRRGDNVMPGEGAIIPLSNVSDSCVAGAPSSVVEGRAFRGLRVTAGDSAAAMPFWREYLRSSSACRWTSKRSSIPI
uniref:Uncharacterized protein n=1 Tax=Haptolina brevifila TaxID=156173 RepID=A0A6U7MNX1_9EUKA